MPYCPEGDCEKLAGGKIRYVTLNPNEEAENLIRCFRCEKVKTKFLEI